MVLDGMFIDFGDFGEFVYCVCGKNLISGVEFGKW